MAVGEIGEAPEHIPLAGNQPRHVGTDVRQRPETVHLQLIDVVLAVKRVTDERRGGGCEARLKQSDSSVVALCVGGRVKPELSDEDLDLIVKALDHYYAYSVARKSEDARFRDLAERLKRKPVETVVGVRGRVRSASNRKT